MIDGLKALLKQPYWTIALLLGVALVVLPSLALPASYGWSIEPQRAGLLIVIGMVLLVLSIVAFGFQVWSSRREDCHTVGAGLDLTRVNERDGVLWTNVSGCEIRVISGRIEDCARNEGAAIVLPCNEYFDDRCVEDPRSSLGAYVSRVFEEQRDQLISMIKDECKRKFGDGTEQQKTNEERARSFGAGKCVLITKPLGRSVPIALVSTTTQRAGLGLEARISYLFEGMKELVSRLADARVGEAIMPVLGAGHGGIDSSLAFVGLVLAVAEAARYGQGGQRLRRVTIVIFRRDAAASPEVDEVVVRRALALVGAQN